MTENNEEKPKPKKPLQEQLKKELREAEVINRARKNA